ncbi:unnamed protein product, partial [Prorocentrum cordatum]
MLGLLEELRSTARPSVRSYSAVASACLRDGALDAALRVAECARGSSVSLEAACYNRLVSLCGGRHRWEDAVHTLEIMLREGSRPNTAARNAAASACLRGARWRLSLRILDSAGRAHAG